MSFDQGKHWQSLQQNLPATPVTDFKVHHGDLSRRRWGDRSGSWTTSRRCARSRRASRTARSRTTDNPNGQVAQAGRRDGVGRVRRRRAVASMQSPRRPRSRPRPAAAPARAGDQAVRRIERVPVHAGADLSHALRRIGADVRICRSIRRSARASTISSPAPSGDLKLEILDAAGAVVRSFSSSAPAAAAGGRGGGVAAADCRRRCRPKPA